MKGGILIMRRIIYLLVGILSLILVFNIAISAPREVKEIRIMNTVTKVKENPNPIGDRIAEIADTWAKRHPGFKITNISVPEGVSTTEWLTAQFAANNEPDLIQTTQVGRFGGNGWTIDITSYLLKPNPYDSKKDRRWIDSLLTPPTHYLHAQYQGKIFGVHHLIVAGCIAYNQNIFKDLGLSPPREFEDFFTMAEKIKAGGYLPMGQTFGNGFWSQIYKVFGDYFLGGDLQKELNVLNEPTDEERALGVTKEIKIQKMSEEEFHRGVVLGYWSLKNKYYVEGMKTLKRFVDKVLIPGFLTADCNALFLTGKLAMNLTDSVQLGSYLTDPLRKFEVGSFWFPKMTKKTFDSGLKDPPLNSGDPIAPWGITRSAMKKGILAEVVDLLQFIVSPRNLQRIASARLGYFPNAYGTTVDPILRPVFHSLVSQFEAGKLRARARIWLIPYNLRAEEEKVQSLVTSYILGEIPLEKAIVQIEEVLKVHYEREIKEGILKVNPNSWPNITPFWER